MDWLVTLNLVIPGFVACAEFGFFVLTQPILRRLPEQFQVGVGKGVVRTYGRVMPIFTALSVILILIYALRLTQNNVANRAVWIAVFFFSAAIATYVWLNQPFEHEISNWKLEQLPADWKSVWRRWVIAQGLRSSFQLAGYIVFCVSIGVR